MVSRGGAFVTDIVLIAVVGHGIAQFALFLRQALPRMGPKVPFAALLLAGAPLLFAAYHVVFWLLRGATPGQWLFGLEVVSLRGGRLRVRQVLARVAGYIVSALPFYLGFLWVLLPPRLAWHDLLAGTAVVHRARGGGAHPARA